MKQLQVAYVINDQKVVLNAGRNDGIILGQKFLIYGLSKEEIIDPATNTSLGRLELVRGTGIVDYVQDTMCILTSNTVTKGAPITSVTRALSGTINYEPFDKPEVGDYAREISTNS